MDAARSEAQPSPSDMMFWASTEAAGYTVATRLARILVEAAACAREPAKASGNELSSPATENTLRVDAERIDAVMNLVGELIIGKSMLHQTINEFGKRFPKDPLKMRFTDAMSKQAQVLNAAATSVMKIRMVPVDQLFRRFPRVLRDAAKSCGKDVELLDHGSGYRPGQGHS